jgi:SanA protein
MIIIVSENFMKKNKKLCFDDIDKIPYNKVGLVLGTTKYLNVGVINPYYQNRIDAAFELFKHKKIDYLIVSGDNSKSNYNEPKQIKADLTERGIPGERIYPDYAGFRTFDSVVRSNKIFGQEDLTVISQQFHNERAIFIAKHKGIKAVGFNAEPVIGRNGLKTRFRERFARVRAVLDVFILRTKPKFLGEKIKIE